MTILKTRRRIAFLVTLLRAGQAFRIGAINPALHAVTQCSARARLTGVTSPILSARATTPLPRTAARPSRAAAATDEHAGDDAGASLAEAILDECHRSARTFRIVVVGNGAILETTSRLGPTSKASASPTTGERLLTFASDDRSFEFHVKVEQVGKVAFVAAKRRVARFLTRDGAPVCSLILMDEANEGAEWFDGLVEKYGSEVVV